jgi:hypothetical protein
MMGMPIFGGALLAELSMDVSIIKFASSRNTTNRIFPFLAVILGLYMFSYPSKNPEWSGWSSNLWQIGMKIFPNGSELFSAWSTLGSIFILFGIVLSEPLQQFLSHPIFLYLGTHSFPIYLIHGPLLRSFLNWMLYIFVAPEWYEDSEGGVVVRTYGRYPIPPAWKFVIALPIFFFVLLWLAQLWTAKVEPQCGALTKWLEDTVCGNDADTPISSQMTLKEYRQKSPISSRSSTPTLNEDILPR